MFGRKKSTTDDVDTVDMSETVGKKGRPTPTRKEAEEIRKQRAKAPRSKKEAAEQQRKRRMAHTSKVKAGMKAGDERYVMNRDKGPVRRLTRDFVDARFSVFEMMIPIMITCLVLQLGGGMLYTVGNNVLYFAFFMCIIDGVWMRMKLKRVLKSRLPDESYRGVTWYAVMRSLQLRFMRLPKPQMRIGQALPERYNK